MRCLRQCEGGGDNDCAPLRQIPDPANANDGCVLFGSYPWRHGIECQLAGGERLVNFALNPGKRSGQLQDSGARLRSFPFALPAIRHLRPLALNFPIGYLA